MNVCRLMDVPDRDYRAEITRRPNPLQLTYASCEELAHPKDSDHNGSHARTATEEAHATTSTLLPKCILQEGEPEDRELHVCTQEGETDPLWVQLSSIAEALTRKRPRPKEKVHTQEGEPEDREPHDADLHVSAQSCKGLCRENEKAEYSIPAKTMKKFR